MDADQIRRIRSFNRTVTQQVGALNEHFLGRGRPLGESRLLYEIGRDGAEVRELRARLELDSGYMSRLLRALERQGLVAGEPDADDSRVRRVRLTPQGNRELRVLNKRSDDFATSVLTPLSPAQRQHLTSAMAVVERLLRASSVRIAAEAPDSGDARVCLERYFAEIDERFEAGFDPAKSIPAEELVAGGGTFLVARLGARPIGCGALKLNKQGFGEIKRMWVAPDARGLGVGRRILEMLEGLARQRGLATLRLDTNRVLKEAQALYRNHGYREVERWSDEPYAHHWFEKLL
jgi:DNA-binding MarR family transcriptional regulator/ribosomal protein S18 acetylase RimI-like enzyme